MRGVLPQLRRHVFPWREGLQAGKSGNEEDSADAKSVMKPIWRRRENRWIGFATTDGNTTLRAKFWRTEPLLGGIALLLLLVGCFFVLRPFLTALMWAIILAYSLHPLQRTFTRWFRGSRTWAACLVTLTVTVVFAGPVVLIGVSLAQDGKDLALATRNWFMEAPEEPPAWVSRMPVVGDEIDNYWTAFAEDRNRWIEQIDKEVKSPPRPKIVAEDGDELVVQDRTPPLVTNGTLDDERKDDSPHVVVLLGQVPLVGEDLAAVRGESGGAGGDAGADQRVSGVFPAAGRAGAFRAAGGGGGTVGGTARTAPDQGGGRYGEGGDLRDSGHGAGAGAGGRCSASGSRVCRGRCCFRC